MERRQVLTAALLAPAITLLPKAAWAGSAGSSLPIEWRGNSAKSKFAPLVGSWIIDKIKARELCLRDDFFGKTVKLTDPSFIVVSGCPVWEYMTGNTKENGLAIYVAELGVPIVQTKVFSAIAAKAYWRKTGRTGNMRIADYVVGVPYLSYSDEKNITPHLPAEHIDIDRRALDVLFEHYKKETTTS